MGGAEAYRAYWAALTGKSEREIYVPESLRDEREGGILMAWCVNCGDEFSATEQSDQETPLCSYPCADEFSAAEQAELDYTLGRKVF